MNSPSITCTALPEKILAVMRDPPVREELNDLIALCHSIAIVHLRRRIPLATLQRRFHYTGFSDLAYDCIADLFRRDDHGSLVRLKAFFRGAVQRMASDRDLLAQMKRLVYSRVNQSIFTMYFEADPSLGKILRNIRLALQTMRHAGLTERGGESCFVR